MPPSEHVLIDQLAYRGARVILASDMGDYAYWVVIRSNKPHGRMLPVMQALEHAINATGELEASPSVLNVPLREDAAHGNTAGAEGSPVISQDT